MGGSIYAVASGKGGVGKTTTAINLGVVLSQAGEEVVVVDADLAMTNLGRRLNVDHQPGIHAVLAGEAPVRDAIVKGPAGLATIPGERDLEAFATAEPEGLREVFDLLTVAYDVVIVDTGPGVQQDAFVTYQEADGALLVTSPRPVAVTDANRTARMAADADCPAVGAAVTFASDAEVPATVDALETDVLAAVPRHQTGGPITASEPDSDAAAAYRTLAAGLPAVDRTDVIPDVAGGPAPETASIQADATAEAVETDDASAEETTDADDDPTAGAAETADETDDATDATAGTDDPDQTADPADADDEAGQTPKGDGREAEPANPDAAEEPASDAAQKPATDAADEPATDATEEPATETVTVPDAEAVAAGAGPTDADAAGSTDPDDAGSTDGDADPAEDEGKPDLSKTGSPVKTFSLGDAGGADDEDRAGRDRRSTPDDAADGDDPATDGSGPTPAE
jgi:septum site-determining protein MinD